MLMCTISKYNLMTFATSVWIKAAIWNPATISALVWRKKIFRMASCKSQIHLNSTHKFGYYFQKAYCVFMTDQLVKTVYWTIFNVASYCVLLYSIFVQLSTQEINRFVVQTEPQKGNSPCLIARRRGTHAEKTITLRPSLTTPRKENRT
jgi:hypothetical protein